MAYFWHTLQQQQQQKDTMKNLAANWFYFYFRMRGVTGLRILG